MLEDDILHVLRSKSSNNLILQQDGAGAHRSGFTKSYIKSEKIELLEDWSAQSPDINPIEDIWGGCQRKLTREFIKNMKELKPTTQYQYKFKVIYFTTLIKYIVKPSIFIYPHPA